MPVSLPSSVILWLWAAGWSGRKAAMRPQGGPPSAFLPLPFAFPFPFWTPVSPTPSVGICRASISALPSSVWTQMPTQLPGVGHVVLLSPDPLGLSKLWSHMQTSMAWCPRLHTHAAPAWDLLSTQTSFHTHSLTHMCPHTCTCAWVHSNTHAHTHICLLTRVQSHMCTCMHVLMLTHLCT